MPGSSTCPCSSCFNATTQPFAPPPTQQQSPPHKESRHSGGAKGLLMFGKLRRTYSIESTASSRVGLIEAAQPVAYVSRVGRHVDPFANIAAATNTNTTTALTTAANDSSSSSDSSFTPSPHRTRESSLGTGRFFPGYPSGRQGGSAQLPPPLPPRLNFNPLAQGFALDPADAPAAEQENAVLNPLSTEFTVHRRLQRGGRHRHWNQPHMHHHHQQQQQQQQHYLYPQQYQHQPQYQQSQYRNPQQVHQNQHHHPLLLSGNPLGDYVTTTPAAIVPFSYEQQRLSNSPWESYYLQDSRFVGVSMATELLDAGGPRWPREQQQQQQQSYVQQWQQQQQREQQMREQQHLEQHQQQSHEQQPLEDDADEERGRHLGGHPQRHRAWPPPLRRRTRARVSVVGAVRRGVRASRRARAQEHFDW
ncbi:hypothetical protein VTJ49DRAFT_617 [Mycothermus thermophilus]|uniref:Uncharacterized protein n=1 Tax=Humicola insolens TaxID=85995 RepID=A0ABR3VPA2_HUMIN